MHHSSRCPGGEPLVVNGAVQVAAAVADDALTGQQHRVPQLQHRLVVSLEGTGPDLQPVGARRGVGRGLGEETPGQRRAQRVRGGDVGAAGPGGLDELLDRAGARVGRSGELAAGQLAPVEPVAGCHPGDRGVPVEPVGHLLTGHQEHVLPCAVGDGEVLADDVVVGQGEEIEPDPPALSRPLRRRQRATGLPRVRALRRVGVQVAAVPAGLVQDDVQIATEPEDPALRSRRQGDEDGVRRRLRGGEDRHDDRPLPRFDEAGQEGLGCGVGGEEELAALLAVDAAEAVRLAERAVVRAALVEDAETGLGVALLDDPDVEPVGPRRDLERVVLVVAGTEGGAGE